MKSNLIVQLGHGRDGRRPLVTAAHKKKARIVLVDNAKGRPAFERADLFAEEKFDGVIFTDGLDHDSIIQAIHQINANQPVGLVVAGFELFTATACRASAELGIPQASSVETIERFRYKSRQRLLLKQKASGVTQPRFRVCASLEEAVEAAKEIGFPAVLKADDSGGSLGVFGVNNLVDVEKAVAQLHALTLDDGNQSNGVFLVEERIEGPELGLQGVVDAAGQVTLLAMTRKTIDTGPENNAFMERCHEAHPATDIPDTVRVFAEQVIDGLELKGSPFHIDVRLSPSGPVLIETGARLSGAYVPRLVQKATGVDWADIALDAWSQGTVRIPTLTCRYSGGLFVSPPHSGQVHGFRFGLSGIGLSHDEELLGDFFAANQTVAGGYRHVSDRIGFLQVTAGSPERVRELLRATTVAVAMSREDS